jgi:hypothetical protein
MNKNLFIFGSFFATLIPIIIACAYYIKIKIREQKQNENSIRISSFSTVEIVFKKFIISLLVLWALLFLIVRLYPYSERIFSVIRGFRFSILFFFASLIIAITDAKYWSHRKKGSNIFWLLFALALGLSSLVTLINAAVVLF